MHRRQFRHPRQGKSSLAHRAQRLHHAGVLPQADGRAEESSSQERLVLPCCKKSGVGYCALSPCGRGLSQRIDGKEWVRGPSSPAPLWGEGVITQAAAFVKLERAI